VTRQPCDLNAMRPARSGDLREPTSKITARGRRSARSRRMASVTPSGVAALSLVKAQAADFGIDPKILDQSDINVHVPAGAIPKDGPSAGVAMFVSLASL